MQNRPLYIIDGDGHTHYINMANSRSVGWMVINYSHSSSASQVCFASSRGAGVEPTTELFPVLLPRAGEKIRDS